jgi:hypothetical protein
MFLRTPAHFVARAVVLLMRFFAARVSYGDNFGWTFTRGMAGCTACVAHSVWTRAYFLAMPRLRAQRTVIWARCAACFVRFRSTVSANHRACDAMMIRFRFLLLFFTQRPCLDLRCQAPYLLTQRPCSDLRCQARTYVLTYSAAMLDR